MRALDRLRTSGVIAVLAVPIAACSPDRVRDLIGLGKSSPDETLITTGRPLALPPDYVLRPPAVPKTAPAPARDGSLQAPAPESESPPGSATTTATDPDGAPAAPARDPNLISKAGPGATPKTAGQIHEETRQIRTIREKAGRPDDRARKNLSGSIRG